MKQVTRDEVSKLFGDSRTQLDSVTQSVEDSHDHKEESNKTINQMNSPLSSSDKIDGTNERQEKENIMKDETIQPTANISSLLEISIDVEDEGVDVIKDIGVSSTDEIMPSKKQTIVVDIADTKENDQIEQPTSTIFSLLENKKTSTLQPDIDSIAFTPNRRSQQNQILIEVAKTGANR